MNAEFFQQAKNNEPFLTEGEEVKLEKNGKLFSEGDPAEHLFFLIEGRIATRKSDPHNTGHVFTTELSGPGDLLGWDALTGDPYSVTAVAEIPSTVVAIPIVKIIKLAKSDPNIARLLHEQLAQAIDRASVQEQLLKDRDPRGRTAGALLDYVRVEPDFKGTVYATRGQLAQRAGMRREHVVSYVLPTLQRSGLVNTSGTTVPKGFQIIDPQGLQGMVRRVTNI